MKKTILLLFMLLSLLGLSQEKDTYTVLTMYNGLPFRPSTLGYSAEISLEKFVAVGYQEKDQGLSLNYEYAGKSNYFIGIKYYRTLFAYFPILYIGLQPNCFKDGAYSNYNIRPEIGLQYDPIWQYVIGLRFRLSYGYDLPVAKTEGSFYNKNVIEFKIGITFNIYHSTSY